MKRILFLLPFLLVSSVTDAQLKKSVTWENIIAHPAPLPVIGELVPVKSDLNAASLWSVGSETLDRDFADFEKYKEYMSETGVGYARLQSGWAKTEKKKGKYDFSWIDAHVDGLLAEGIHPWICLCYGNPVYSDHGYDLNAALFPDGPVMDAWLRYVKACVSRYKGKVTMWEVWNEPDGAKGEMYPLYANLFVRTAKVIRETDPEAKVAAFGVCSPDKKFIRQALELIEKADGIKYIDYLTYHAYWQIPEKVIPAVRELRKDVDAYNPGIVLLQGETGCPGQLEYGHAMSSIEWTEYNQAKWDVRQSLSHFGMGVQYSFFTMVDLNYGWMLQSFGLIRMNGNKTPVYKRPKFYAVQHVTSVFTPDMKATESVKALCETEEHVISFGLEKDGKPVGCMLWMDGERPTSSLERKLRQVQVEGLVMQEPVYVDMLTGLVHDLEGIAEKYSGTDPMTSFKELPVWDCPVVIIEKSALSNAVYGQRPPRP